MKIASITCIFENELFIKPHFEMIKGLDENIVLIGRKPFKEYFEAGFVSDKPDNSEALIREMYPKAHIVYHDFDTFCGNLLNVGIDKAIELGCDAILKLDVDMLLTREDWYRLMNGLQTTDCDTLSLDYANNTMVYKKDFEHGVRCWVFPVGNDPVFVKTNCRFIQDGGNVKTTGRKQGIINDVMVHHFTQIRRKDADEELKRVESLPNFPGWVECPAEIQDMFLCDTRS